jgi:hypothetical protein
MEYKAMKERSKCILAKERDIPWAERIPAKGTLKVALEPVNRSSVGLNGYARYSLSDK